MHPRPTHPVTLNSSHRINRNSRAWVSDYVTHAEHSSCSNNIYFIIGCRLQVATLKVEPVRLQFHLLRKNADNVTSRWVLGLKLIVFVMPVCSEPENLHKHRVSISYRSYF